MGGALPPLPGRRHHPFEVRCRVGRLWVDLVVLDLTDDATRSRLGLSRADLVSDDCTLTQDIAAAARNAGFDAVLAPAAALSGCKTLAMFADALPAAVTAKRSEVRQPPPRLADLLPLIRPHEDVSDTVRRLLITRTACGRGDPAATPPVSASVERVGPIAGHRPNEQLTCSLASDVSPISVRNSGGVGRLNKAVTAVFSMAPLGRVLSSSRSSARLLPRRNFRLRFAISYCAHGRRRRAPRGCRLFDGASQHCGGVVRVAQFGGPVLGVAVYENRCGIGTVGDAE